MIKLLGLTICAVLCCNAQVNGLGHSTATCLDKDGDGYGVGPGCAGPDADDNDASVHSASQAIAVYGSVNGFLIHLGYQSSTTPLTVWCISPTGSDSTGAASTNADTACANPFLTWAHVSGVLAAPYIALFRAGTYTANVGYIASGTSTVQNVVMAYPGELPLLDYSASSGNTINMAATSYVTFDGFKIHANASGAGYAGGTYILYMSGSQTITFIGDVLRRCEIYGGGSDSNVDADNVTNFTVEENVIHDPDPVAGQHNVYIGSNTVASSGVIVRRNILYNVHTGGYPNLQFNGRCTGCYFEDNMLYNADGQEIALLEGVSNSFVRRNLAFNTGTASQQAISFTMYNYDSGQCQMTGLPSICPWDQTGNTIENNTFWAGTIPVYGTGTLSGETVEISNAATTGPCGNGGTPPCGNLGGNFYRNNVIVGSGAVDHAANSGYPPVLYVSSSQNYLASDTWTNNIINSQDGSAYILGFGTGSSYGYFPYDCASFNSMALSGSAGCGTGAPAFANAATSNYSTPSAFDFHLTTGSAAIAAGTSTGIPTWDVQGHYFQPSTPSIGAYEFPPTWTDLGSGSLPSLAFTPNAGTCGISGACTSANYAFTDEGPAMIRAWTSAAMDLGNNRLLSFGGGHGDYYGNEVRSLDFDTSAFTRSYPPSCFNYSGSGTTPCMYLSDASDALDDGSPASRHTYNGFQCVARREMCFQAGGVIPGGNVSTIWTLDVSAPAITAANWTQHGAHPGINWNEASCIDDPTADQAWCLGDGQYLYAYVYGTDTWVGKNTGGISPFAPESNTALLDAAHYRMIIAGQPLAGPPGQIGYIDLTGSDSYQFHDMTATTAGTCTAWINDPWPGMDIDPNDGKVAGRALNNNTVYILDLNTWQCATVTASGGPPTTSLTNGVMGKWRYVPSVGGFAFISDYNADSFVFTRSYATGPPSTAGVSIAGAATLSGGVAIQ